MAAGVHLDRGLTEPMPSMADQTDVGMEREDLGQMMSTGCQVSVKISAFSVQPLEGNYTNTDLGYN